MSDKTKLVRTVPITQASVPLSTLLVVQTKGKPTTTPTPDQPHFMVDTTSADDPILYVFVDDTQEWIQINPNLSARGELTLSALTSGAVLKVAATYDNLGNPVDGLVTLDEIYNYFKARSQEEN